MSIRCINSGYGILVSSERIVAIVSPDDAPVQRLVQEAKGGGNAVDATCGRKTRAVIVCDSGHVVLSALMPDTILSRLHSFKDTDDE